PARLEAHEPPEARGLRRDRVRLMIASRGAGAIVHTRFDELPSFLLAGDLLVVNTSATLPPPLSPRPRDRPPLPLPLPPPPPPLRGPPRRTLGRPRSPGEPPRRGLAGRGPGGGCPPGGGHTPPPVPRAAPASGSRDFCFPSRSSATSNGRDDRSATATCRSAG